MATALDVVTRAARKRLRESGLTLTSAELEDGLADLNDMLAQWSIDGIDLAHIALISTDELDVPDDHLQAIVLSLAERLTDFGGQLDPADIRRAEEARMALRAYHFTIAQLGGDHPLSHT
jgi:hypothetical protein